MDIANEVRRIIKRRAPASSKLKDMVDELQLHDGGLGLDSVALIELILECEERFEVKFSREFLDAGKFTVGAIIDHIDRIRAD